MNAVKRFLPLLVAAVCALWLVGRAVPPKDDPNTFRVEEFARLPIVHEGRVKPLDTLARNSLVIVSDRQTLVDARGIRRPAIEWLLDVMSGKPAADQHRVFRIHNDQLETQLGLEPRQGFRYAFAEFAPRLAEVEQQAFHAGQLDRAQRDVYDNKVLEFQRRVTLYHVLMQTHALPDPANPARTARVLEALERLSVPHVVPPRQEGEAWRPFLRAAVDDADDAEPNPAIAHLAGMLAAWRNDDPVGFNAELDAYQAFLAAHPLPEDPELAFEAGFNHAAPFYHCAVLYVMAFLLCCFSWLGWTELLRRTAFALLAVTFVAHTLAILARVHISGYPPITNLYGTAIFIGWGCVFIGLVLESMNRMGIGNLVSSTVGFITLIIAHFLSGDGDTLQMMQAVLDTKFWLATHVIIINFGYSATFLAGGLSVLYILRGVLTRSLDASSEQAFSRMIHGVVSFALLLSFLGTVLGGLWADDSWGRFWGWDPKENGALMIVLWNALILHARWAGLAKARGMASLCVFGNIITSWSWFGVNQLGVGLHSYGFTDSVTFWLLVFVATQLAIMGLGLLPRRLWRSFSPGRPAARGDGRAAAGAIASSAG